MSFKREKFAQTTIVYDDDVYTHIHIHTLCIHMDRRW